MMGKKISIALAGLGSRGKDTGGQGVPGENGNRRYRRY